MLQPNPAIYLSAPPFAARQHAMTHEKLKTQKRNHPTLAVEKSTRANIASANAALLYRKIKKVVSFLVVVVNEGKKRNSAT
jgi:hypothetical protein